METTFIPFNYKNSISSNEEIVGILELFDSVHLEELFDGAGSGTTVSEPTYTKSQSTVLSCSQLCLLNVPSHMIPFELLHFLSPRPGQIASIQVFKHLSFENKYLAVISLANCEAVTDILNFFHGQVMTTVERTVCSLFPIKSINIETQLVRVNCTVWQS
jgi:hypothetical protein